MHVAAATKRAYVVLAAAAIELQEALRRDGSSTDKVEDA